MGRSPLIAVAALAILAASPASAQSDLRGELEALLAGAGSPGAVVTLVKDGQVLLHEGFGTVKPGGSDLVSTSTAATVASVTKTFGALAVAILVADGDVRWEDPVVQYLPDFSFGGADRSSRVTLRDLVTHRAGLPNIIGDLWSPDTTISDLLAALPDESPRAPLRDRLQYSQVGVALLGEVVARVSGLSWPDFVQARILDPLGMNGTLASTPAILAEFPEPDANPRLMGRLVRDGDDYSAGPWRGFGEVYSPAGGMATTGDDMLRYMQFWLTGEPQLVPSEALAAMWIPLAVEPSVFAPLVNPFSDLTAYGHGWYAYDFQGHRLVEHPGANSGSAVVALIPSEGIGLFIATSANFYPDSERLVSSMKFAALAYALQTGGQ